MKHPLAGDLNVNLNIPTQDIEDLLDKTAETAIGIILVYMVSDTVRHILKSLIK